QILQKQRINETLIVLWRYFCAWLYFLAGYEIQCHVRSTCLQFELNLAYFVPAYLIATQQAYPLAERTQVLLLIPDVVFWHHSSYRGKFWCNHVALKSRFVNLNFVIL